MNRRNQSYAQTHVKSFFRIDTERDIQLYFNGPRLFFQLVRRNEYFNTQLLVWQSKIVLYIFFQPEIRINTTIGNRFFFSWR